MKITRSQRNSLTNTSFHPSPLQIIAEETQTTPKLSSTATLTVTVTDANDNRPVFEHESYSFSVSESASANQFVGTIQAKDLDSGRFGTNGVRYSLTGAGSELFRVSETGTITVAQCPQPLIPRAERKRRQIAAAATVKPVPNAKKVNLTIVGETGFVDLNEPSTMPYFPYGDVTFRPYYSVSDDYIVMSEDSDEETTTTHTTNAHQSHHIRTNHADIKASDAFVDASNTAANTGPGYTPCLDYETQSAYFLTFKVFCSGLPLSEY